jgi:tetratricopeptide (TPR) repeat protein
MNALGKYGRILLAAAALGTVALPGPVRAEDSVPRSVAEFVKKKGISESKEYLDHMRQAVLELKSQNYFRAMDLLGKAHKAAQDHPLPGLLLGFAFARVGYVEQASSFLRHSVQIFPGLRDADFTYTTYQPDAEEFGQVVESLKKKIDGAAFGSKPRSQAAFVTGVVLFFGGRKEEAKKYFEMVDANAPEHPQAAWFLRAFAAAGKKKSVSKTNFFELGNRQFAGGRYREAAFAFGIAYVENPDNVVACFELSHALFACGEFRKAARMIVHGIGRYPDWGGVAMNLREFYAKTRRADFDRRLAELRGECEKTPGDPALAYLLGYVYYYIRRPDESSTAFQRAKVAGWITESDYFLAYLRGKPHAKDEKKKEEKTPVPPGPEKKKGILEVWLGHLSVGNQAFKEGRYADAAAAYAEALRVRPEAGMVRFEQARALFASGRFAESVRLVRQGLDGLAEDQRAHIRWKAAYPDAKTFEEHLGILEKKVTDPGATGDLQFLYAFSLFYSGRFRKAASGFEKVFLQNPKDTQAISYFKLIDNLLKKK